MPKFGETMPTSQNETEETSPDKTEEETVENYEEIEKLFEQMGKDAKEKYIRQEEAFRKFETIEAELAEKLGDDFDGLDLEDAERVSEIVSKCDHSRISVTPLCLKMQNVLEGARKSE